MKNTIISYIYIQVLLGVIPWVSWADDHVFFKNDSHHFVRTDIIKNEKIKISGCTVLENSARGICSPIALIHKKQFHEIRKCENHLFNNPYFSFITSYAGTIVPGVSVGAYAVEEFSEALGLNDAYAIHSTVQKNTEENSLTSLQYDPRVENNIDHKIQTVTYNQYVRTLRESFERSFFSCDISDGVEILDGSLIEVLELTSAQLASLRGQSASNVETNQDYQLMMGQ